ncbi:MAG TPA: gluconate 2-dehydrogenase subunit 3 family protein [Terriglobia bacterium]|nr:gluconate 2-dehydrogenase subunit 3 family protein [Terriglobia bacterium]
MSENRNGKRQGGIKRRDVLKAISVAPVALLPMGTALAGEKKGAGSAAAKAASGYQRKVFNEHEWETVKVLSDLIIPADESGGSASQAGVPAFIDDWLNFQGGNLKPGILGGITWLDVECNRAFGHDFVRCTTAEQKKMLDRIAYPGKAAPEDANYVAFFNDLRDLVAAGYFSSKMGLDDLHYLGNRPSNEWNGCPENVLEKIETNLKKLGVGLNVSST